MPCLANFFSDNFISSTIYWARLDKPEMSDTRYMTAIIAFLWSCLLNSLYMRAKTLYRIFAQHGIFIPDCDSGFGSSLICGGSSISPDILRPLEVAPEAAVEANRPHLRCKELWGEKMLLGREGCKT